MNVLDAATSESLRFLGSPSIRVDGIDVEPAARTAREYALTCRTYLADGRIEGLPTRQLIHQGMKEAARLAPERAAVSGGSAKPGTNKVAFSAR